MEKKLINSNLSGQKLLAVGIFIFAVLSAPLTIASQQRDYNGPYTGDHLSRVAFPLGGIGAGMICLEGTGALSHVSLYNTPDIFKEPCTFSAISIKGGKNIARVLQGPLSSWKLFGDPGSGRGSAHTNYGLPRFAEATFQARFPFANIDLQDPKIPLKVQVTGWSPFIPGDADNSSLPVAALEYQFTNPTSRTIEAVYSFNTKNFMSDKRFGGNVSSTKNGFLLSQLENKGKPWRTGSFAAFVDDPDTKVNCAWFRSGWFDSLTMAWKDVQKGKYYDKAPPTEGNPSPGATIFVPFKLKPGQKKTIKLMLCWYVPESNLRVHKDPEIKESCDSDSACASTDACGPKTPLNYKPWYSGRFKNITEVVDYWRDNYTDLQKKSRQFSDCFYDTTLPPEVIEAVAANLTILKSPTVLRQTDGKLWAFEGCNDNSGCCPGSCTHVWNYAQAIPHLFPDLERTLRQTEFHESQAADGMQQFRSAIPIRRVVPHYKHAAADGQLGGIMKIYRDWRISGDTEWLKNIWPKVKQSLDYCIEAWDPEHNGILSEPHHNTYDIEFWGPDGMCSSFYLGALKAAIEIEKALGDQDPLYAILFKKGQKYVNKKLFNGEYFYQKIQWKGLRAKNPTKTAVLPWGGKYSSEAIALLEKEGPKYQYGTGCLSDGVLGSWMARVCGLDEILNEKKIARHLNSVHKYNFKKDLSEHANPQRPGYAAGSEGGLLLCSWPKGGQLSLPFVYSNEVWTGIEYQVASHLMMQQMTDKGLEIVRTCRDRYDGRIRNPFNEYECGHWYARAMSSYAMLQALSGARYDAVEKVLYLKPTIKGDFKSFLSTAFGYGTVGVKKGKPFFDICQGNVPIKRIEYSAK